MSTQSALACQNELSPQEVEFSRLMFRLQKEVDDLDAHHRKVLFCMLWILFLETVYMLLMSCLFVGGSLAILQRVRECEALLASSSQTPSRTALASLEGSNNSISSPAPSSFASIPSSPMQNPQLVAHLLHSVDEALSGVRSCF